MKQLAQITVLSLFSATALGGSAFAGSLQQPVATPPVVSVVPVAPSSDWTGFYGGLQFGTIDGEGPTGLDGNNTTYGVHAGYDYDFGQFVLGGEVDYDKTDLGLNAGAASVDNVARAKLRAGYDLGNMLLYATAGAARADTSAGNETGPFVGIGLDYKVTEQYTIGAEVLEHRFDDVGGVAGNDLDATTLNIRGSFRF